MDAARWRRIEDLFERCVDAESAVREELLAQAGAEDPALARRVRAMLEAPEALLTDGMDAARAERAVGESAGLDDGPPPARLGPWRLGAEIGRGGSGVVYRAERVEGYRAQAALKLVRPGSLHGDVLGRLRQERQILARLEHPHIARLLDGGSAPDGRPYLVMEYVDGEPIDRWCAARRLGVEGRVRLVIDICAAVHAAHRRLIVHRDLKPANILVTGDGVPKLLDFGIAKLLRPELALELEEEGEGPRTVAGLRLLTPVYASPEQIRGAPVTTATDVYSLGVVLYQLLTGSLPFAARDDWRAFEDAVCERMPPPPSQRVDAEGCARAGLPEPPARLVRRLRGDLDAIVLQALRKEPEERYASAEQLADDLDRMLQDLPVRARRESLAQRGRKWVRRHRVASAAAATVLSVLVGSSVVTVRQARIADSERQRAEKVTELLVDVFRGSDPVIEPGTTPSAREILDRGAARVADSLMEQPVLRADLLQVLGQVYQNLGEYRRAAELQADALAQRRRSLSADDPRVAESLNSLGEAHFAQGRFEAADEALTEALRLRRQSFDERAPEVAESLNNLAALRFARGDLAAAEELFRRALDAWSATLPADDSDRVQGLDNLAAVLARRGQYDESIELLRRSLALRTSRHGVEHPLVARAAANLASVLHAAERLDEAAPLYRTALAAQVAALGPEHPQVAITRTNLGVLAARRGDRQTAIDQLQRAAATQRARLGDHHPQLALTLLHLAETFESTPEKALPYADEALAIRRQAFGAGHSELALPLLTVARLQLARAEDGDADRAASAAREALAVLGDDTSASARSQRAEANDLVRRAAALQEVSRPAPERPTPPGSPQPSPAAPPAIAQDPGSRS
ncbi:MAG: serine/threonine-protein kinase [Acidobacteriota bacterium]